MGVGTRALDEGFGLPGRWNRLRVDARGLYPRRVTCADDSHSDAGAGAGECTNGGGVCGVGGRSDALARTRRVTENKVVEGGRNGKVLESAPRGDAACRVGEDRVRGPGVLPHARSAGPRARQRLAASAWEPVPVPWDGDGVLGARARDLGRIDGRAPGARRWRRGASDERAGLSRVLFSVSVRATPSIPSPVHRPRPWLCLSRRL